MKNFRTFDIANKFYHECKSLPLKGNTRDQLDRAALSIALNLAEGRGKPTLKDQKKFFYIAMGSLRESQALLSLMDLDNTETYKTADSLGAHLYLLIKNARETR